jgi:predicted MFS family arabinose efflux permease
LQSGPRPFLRQPDFVKLALGESISRLGSQVSVIGLPTLAIQAFDAGPLEVGTLAAVQSFPFLILGLPAGVIADRVSRWWLMIVCDIGRLLVLGSIPFAWWIGQIHLGNLYAVGLLSGVFTVFANVARQAYLPAIVARDQLTEANGRIEAANAVAVAGGQGLAGWLIEWLRPALAIGADAISYAISAVTLLLIRRPEAPTSQPGQPRAGFMRDLIEGLRVAWEHPMLRSVAGCTALVFLGSNMVNSILLLFAYQQLGFTPGTLGLALMIASVGSLFGSTAAPMLVARFGAGRTMAIAAAIGFSSNLLLPLATLGLAFVLYTANNLIWRAGFLAYIVTSISVRQQHAPAHVQGRLAATLRTVGYGATSIGAAAGGVLGEWLGLIPVILVGTALALISVPLAWGIIEPDTRDGAAT